MSSQLHHVTISISPRGIAQARMFYGEILGFKEIPRVANPLSPSEEGLWFQVGERQLHIAIEHFPERINTMAHVAYRVSNVDELIARLKANAFVCDEAIVLNGHRRTKLRDPFGNRIEFLQKL